MAFTVTMSAMTRNRDWKPVPVPVTSPLFQLSILGGFEFTVEGQSLSVFPFGERLLAFLALRSRSRPIGRIALAEELWPDIEPARAAANLRSVLWRLPRPYGCQLVRTTASTLHLATDIAVDLWHADDTAHAVENAGAALDGEAGAAYCAGGQDARDPINCLTGELLPGWPEDWLMIERESFHQTRLHALEQLSEQLRSRGHYAGALRASLTAVQCEPLRESAHRRVIEVHLAEGNEAEALRQYHSFRASLATELGLPPSASIRKLIAPLLGRPLDR